MVSENGQGRTQTLAIAMVKVHAASATVIARLALLVLSLKSLDAVAIKDS
jgi:hypothetical protein